MDDKYSKNYLTTVIDLKYPQRIIDINGQEIQFKDYHAEIPLETAYILSRNYHDEYLFPNLDTNIPFKRNSWSKEKRIIWSCNYASANGFGYVAENTVKYLKRAGYDVYNPGFVSGNLVAGGGLVDEEVKDTIGKAIFPDCLEVQHCQPPAFREGIVDKSWIYTMFETTHTPKRWIKIMNKVKFILTPTSWIIPYWQEQGLKTPVEVYGHGIDKNAYSYLDRPVNREPYTFLHFCQLSIRKGIDIVAKAFVEEFRGQNDVKLVVKNTYPVFPIPYNLPNVVYIAATYTKEQMRDMMFNADCFVFPTRGEGFGLTPFEAMATGLPTIVTGWSGPADYIDKDDTLILDYDMVRSDDFNMLYKDHLEYKEDTGYWAEPKFEQVRHYMRWCYENREKAKEMGKRAAERLARDWSWEKKVGELIGIINKNLK